MASPPFQFTLAQTEAIRLQDGFRPIHTKTYYLPTFHPIILAKLPKTEHSCHSCGRSFIQQMPGQGPLEKPVVIPCGHICGSRCLEQRLDTAIPKCFICKRVFPLSLRGKFGVHGRAEVAAAGFTVSNLRAETSSMPPVASSSHEQETIRDVIDQAELAIQAGSKAEDIEAANILVNMSAAKSYSGQFVTAKNIMPPTVEWGEPRHTIEEMEKAVKHVNSLYGVSLSLGDLRVALMLSDIRNGTETTIGEALSDWY